MPPQRSVHSSYLILVAGFSILAGLLAGCKDDGHDVRRQRRPIPGGVFELRLLANRNQFDSTTLVGLVANASKNGPAAASPDALAWFEVSADVDMLDETELVVAHWKRQRYVLVETGPGKVLDGSTAWAVTDFELVRNDPQYGWQLLFELDQAGGSQLEALTTANLGRTMGIFLFNRLERHAVIMDVTADRISLSGGARIKTLHERLEQIAAAP